MSTVVKSEGVGGDRAENTVMRTSMLLRITRLSAAFLLIALPSAFSLGLSSGRRAPAASAPQSVISEVAPVLDGDWAGAKAALRNPDCCVVTVPGLESHLRVLQAHFVNSGPAELDLRARIFVNNKSSSAVTDPNTGADAYNDCLRVQRLVSPSKNGNDDDDDGNDNINKNDPCTVALEELARGIASLADGPLEGVCDNVFLRIVCASDYRAIDPMYHTDKAPLRGYVTLRGVGTEFMTRPCSPVEYVTLRGLGSGDPVQNVRMAEELEFIVMKGDHYECNGDTAVSWMNKIWKRTAACVHRSPPAAMSGGRRVIVSLDLGDGDDDREWYQANTKREWRSGMTQRKSRLVS